MASNETFKVIVAGAGVAGLTLANMLEKFDLDYVVLEAHDDVAPRVGASIGMLPNGLRILDQVGCYEPIRRLPFQPGRESHSRDSTGKSINSVVGQHKHALHRHGYPVIFFDRQWLLQALYDQLKHKDRVLLGKKVAKIIHREGGVEVTTAAGDSFSGTLVVGADGVHSAVRRIMVDLGHQLQPERFSGNEEDAVPCYYKCSFGIAQNVPGFPDGEVNRVMGRGSSQLIVSGPEKRVYWFIFVRLPEVKYGKAIPKYTKQDEAEFVRKYRSLPVSKNVNFGQLFDHKLTSTLTPLHEYVWDNWFFKRIVLLGDSVHKPNPLTGQGGNSAIETAAELINSIICTKNDRPGGLNNLTNTEIETIFRRVQTARQERAKHLIAESHRNQALSAYENIFVSTIAWNISIPLASNESLLELFSGPFLGATRLKDLPVPHRARVIPFDDELPARPLARAQKNLSRAALAGGMGILYWIIQRAWRSPIVQFGTWADVALISRPWSGSTGVSSLLTRLVSVFSYPLAGEDVTSRVHLMNFLSQLVSPILIYTVEGYRTGNRRTLLALPGLFNFAFQLHGIGRIAPLWAAFHAYLNHGMPSGRFVPTETAKALLPAVAIGYVIPTVMMFARTPNVGAWQDATALWQFAPPLVNVLAFAISAGLNMWKRRNLSEDEKKKAAEEEPYERYGNEDVPTLKTTYAYAFVTQATAHIATVAYAYLHPGISIGEMFFGLHSPFKKSWNLPTATAQIAALLKWDMVGMAAAFTASNLCSVWQLRSQGYIQTREAIKAAVGVALGQFAVGTGSTWAGLWYWREGVLDGLRKQ